MYITRTSQAQTRESPAHSFAVTSSSGALFRRNVRMMMLTKQMVNACKLKHGLHGGHVTPHPSRITFYTSKIQKQNKY